MCKGPMARVGAGSVRGMYAGYPVAPYDSSTLWYGLSESVLSPLSSMLLALPGPQSLIW